MIKFRSFTIFMFMFMLQIAYSQQNYFTVKFEINMLPAYESGLFNPDINAVELRSNSLDQNSYELYSYAEFGEPWVYSVDVAIPLPQVGEYFPEFIFWILPDKPESISPRTFEFTQKMIDREHILYVTEFDNHQFTHDDGTGSYYDLFMKFEVNMLRAYEEGLFNPETDRLELRGDYFGDSGIELFSYVDEPLTFSVSFGIDNITAGDFFPEFYFWISPDQPEIIALRTFQVTQEILDADQNNYSTRFNDPEFLILQGFDPYTYCNFEINMFNAYRAGLFDPVNDRLEVRCPSIREAGFEMYSYARYDEPWTYNVVIPFEAVTDEFFPEFYFWISPDKSEIIPPRTFQFNQEMIDQQRVLYVTEFNNSFYTHDDMTAIPWVMYYYLFAIITDLDGFDTEMYSSFADLINNAKTNLEFSSKSEYWLDYNHFSSSGEKVFKYHKTAVSDLEKIIKSTEGELFDFALLTCKKIASLDRWVARNLMYELGDFIDEFAPNNKKAIKELEKAEVLLEDGNINFNNNEFKKAIMDFSKVWEHATRGFSYLGKNSAESTINSIPMVYSLNQNYPNPFNPSTTIEYSIAKNDFVTIKVFNILGKEVKTLISQYLSPGNYRINFESGDLSSGLYFYNITTSSFSETKKMLLVK